MIHKQLTVLATMSVTLMCAVMLASSIPVQAVSNTTTTINFLLMVASESSVNVSTLVSAVNQTLKEINMDMKFNMKYGISDDKVECTGIPIGFVITSTASITVQCNKSSTVLLQ